MVASLSFTVWSNLGVHCSRRWLNGPPRKSDGTGQYHGASFGDVEDAPFDFLRRMENW